MFSTTRFAAVLVTAALLSGCAQDLVVLLPDEDGRVGRIGVTKDGETLVLDQAFAASRSAFYGVEPDTVDEARLRGEFAAALDATPPAPVDYTVYFEEGTTRVTAASRADFERFLADVRARTVSDVQVTGHTDRVGSVEDNDALARQRAAMVRSVLMRQGIAPESILAVGRGEREPLVATPDGVAEPRNRRVQITLR